MYVTKLASAIIDGKADRYLEVWADAIRTRQRILRDQEAARNRAELVAGTRVRLKGLNPKYLNGLTGVVALPDQRPPGRAGDIAVELTESSYARMVMKQTGRRRFGRVLSVPAACLEALDES